MMPTIEVEDDDVSSLITLPYYNGGTVVVNTGSSVSLKVPDDSTPKAILHTTEITEGSAVSLHTDDDSTSYQNSATGKAGAIFIIECRGTGTEPRHIKVYSSPTDNSATGTVVFDYDGDGKGNFNSSTEELTVLIPNSIAANHYIVIENVDESRAGVNNIRVNEIGWVAEQS